MDQPSLVYPQQSELLAKVRTHDRPCRLHAHSIAAEILRGFTRPIAPRLIKLSMLFQRLRLKQRHLSHAVIARHDAGNPDSCLCESSFSAYLRGQIPTSRHSRPLQSQQTGDKTIQRQIENLARQLSSVPPLFALIFFSGAGSVVPYLANSSTSSQKDWKA